MQTCLNTLAVADLCRRDKTRLYEVFNTPECQPWLPPKKGIGEGRAFNPRQTLLTMMHSDFTRWGLSVPFAGRLVTRIAEVLFEHPDADVLTISFHENGASFFAADQGHDDLPSEGNGAGHVRFRVQMHLSAYREAINSALSEVEDAA
jgi:hypothetical protein